MLVRGIVEIVLSCLPFGLEIDLHIPQGSNGPHAVQDRQCHGGLLSITALAEGQTITNAKILMFAELVWTPSTIDQCEATS